jgi:hypothetical protein
MSFFDNKMTKNIQKQRELIKAQIEERQKAAKQLDEGEVESIIPEIQKHYMEQFKLPAAEREYFVDEAGAAYIVFQTDDDKITKKNSDGEEEIVNLPKEVSGGKSYHLWCQFPLMTDEESAFTERVTVFVTKELFTFGQWKTVILAKGRMDVKYKMTTDKGYAKSLAKMLKEEKVESLDDLDIADYVRKFTFSLDQVLETQVFE